MYKIRTTIFFIIIIILFSFECVFSQVFTKVTNSNNPIITDPSSGFYIGASWVDFDNDGLLDLYISRQSLYRNLGNGNFEKVTAALPNQGPVTGNSWADYDNDGDLDCFLVSTVSNDSYLYRNDGGGVFTKITTGAIGNAAYNTGWGCSWADYNNDGFVDLIIAAANNFGVVNHPSRFFENKGDGTFSRIDTTLFTTQLAPYTIPTWSDYDLDGDMDLFIGSGPANGVLARDYLFNNLFIETGTATLERIDTGILGTDLVDGQVWNWIDYDNDGDLDAYLTNYKSTEPNNLYRNDGNQNFIKMTAQQVGSIVSDAGLGLTNVWGDFDNDGDLDCIVTNDDVPNRYYKNNNDGTFSRITNLSIVSGNGPHFGITTGDYNNDGFIDLYITGTNATKGLYKNDSNNGNSWINIKCSGVGGTAGSNYSAIGTRVNAKAIISGNPVWQMREVSSQNSFNSMNMLNVHFGFGDAVIIDTLIITWPSGVIDISVNIPVNNFYEVTEGQPIVVGIENENENIPTSISLEQNYPNPFNPATIIKYQLSISNNVVLKVYDAIGNEIVTLVNRNQLPGSYSVEFNAKNFSSGIYFYQLFVGNMVKTKKMVLIR